MDDKELAPTEVPIGGPKVPRQTELSPARSISNGLMKRTPIPRQASGIFDLSCRSTRSFMAHYDMCEGVGTSDQVVVGNL